MTTKEIKAIMEAINGCQGVIGLLAMDHEGLMSECNDKELRDTYFRLNSCWLYLRRMIKEAQE